VEERGGGRLEGTQPDELVDTEAAARRPPDGQQRRADRDRREHRVHPAPVGEPGVDQRRSLVDAPPGATQQPLHHREDVVGIAEAHRAAPEPPVDLDVDLLRGVDDDLGDRPVSEERLERPQAGEVVGRRRWCLRGDPAAEPVDQPPATTTTDLCIHGARRYTGLW